MPTKPAAKKPGGVVPRQFRLRTDTLADLDLIAEHHSAETGIPCTRSDAVRLSARREADRIRKRRGETR
jgi:hypothetical protein